MRREWTYVSAAHKQQTRLRDALLRADDMDDAMAIIGHREMREIELF